MTILSLSKPTYELLHVDDYVLVVAKAKGVLTTPAHGEEGLVDELDRRYVGRRKLLVVHRLDRDTSGVLVFARTAEAARKLAEQFARHAVEREYVATVEGVIGLGEGRLEEPVLGKKAVTHFKVLAREVATTTLSLRLETGRRNQIRRHLASMGHPILGDARFGAAPREAPGIALHARTLGFEHPKSGERVLFQCPIQENTAPPTV